MKTMSDSECVFFESLGFAVRQATQLEDMRKMMDAMIHMPVCARKRKLSYMEKFWPNVISFRDRSDWNKSYPTELDKMKSGVGAMYFFRWEDERVAFYVCLWTPKIAEIINKGDVASATWANGDGTRGTYYSIIDLAPAIFAPLTSDGILRAVRLWDRDQVESFEFVASLCRRTAA